MGVNVAVGVIVSDGVKVASGVSVKTLVAVTAIVAGVTWSSVEGAQAETNKKISKINL